MPNSSSETSVLVFGEILLKVKTREDKISPIYEILANAPTITFNHYTLVYALLRLSRNDADHYDPLRLVVTSQGYLEGTLEKTFNEVREFVKYLNSCKDILSAEGKIDISEINGHNDEIDKETKWTIKIKNQNSTNI